jgi:hypothetical protein
MSGTGPVTVTASVFSTSASYCAPHIVGPQPAWIEWVLMTMTYKFTFLELLRKLKGS